MRMREAQQIIDDHCNQKNKGYMVHFENRHKGILSSDYFPDKHDDEELIETEELAWDLANQFHEATTKSIVNIYVVDENWVPVKNYDIKTLRRYDG